MNKRKNPLQWHTFAPRNYVVHNENINLEMNSC